MQNVVNDSSAQAFIITENPEEPYKNGIIYSCLPPSKRFLQIQYLSDGEKTLASLALLFTMMRYILTLSLRNFMYILSTE